MDDKKRTVNVMKEKREVPAGVRDGVKEFNRTKKVIIGALKPEPKTIPEIAEETGLERNDVTYHLMSLMKFGEVEEDRMDDMDEYYYYRLKED